MALRRFTLLGFWALLGLLAVLALLQYPGRVAIYIVFTVTANLLLYFGFRRNAIFFDTFIGVFFWLGFWLKLTVRVAFLDGLFHEPTGHFDGSGSAFDRALLVASCAFVGLLLASLLRARFFNYPATATEYGLEGLRTFYERHRKAVLIGAALLIVAVAVTNFLFGIYQRGMVSRTALPFGLGGVYSWLLLFGLASLSALVLNFEIVLRKSTSTPAVALALMESFLTNASLLSRGMILNAGALGYGLFRALGFAAIWQRFRFWAAAFIAFVILFGCSIVLVNYLRMTYLDPDQEASLVLLEAGRTTSVLMLDRWVGIEGVMAISSYPEQGWALLSEAWQERPARKMSFYDAKMIVSPYANMDTTKHHHISLPGIVGFFFYPGSFVFLFTCMVMLGLLAAAIEISVFKLGGRNLVLCALLSQVVAARYAHFGYAPAQSYLLFGALYLNLFLIYWSDKALSYWRANNPA